MTDWQPIATAPKDGTEIDLWLDSGMRLTRALWTGAYWFSADWKYDCGAELLPSDPQPTYWMPSPAPPATSNNGVMGSEPASFADFQQRRGRLPDLIEEAIQIHTDFMMDDNYDAYGCLDRIVAKLKTARDFYDACATPKEPDPCK